MGLKAITSEGFEYIVKLHADQVGPRLALGQMGDTAVLINHSVVYTDKLISNDQKADDEEIVEAFMRQHEEVYIGFNSLGMLEVFSEDGEDLTTIGNNAIDATQTPDADSYMFVPAKLLDHSDGQIKAELYYGDDESKVRWIPLKYIEIIEPREASEKDEEESSGDSGKMSVLEVE